MIKYKDSTCSIQCLKFKASTCRLHFGWECHCHRSKRYPPFESGLPPPLGITEVPGVLFSPFFIVFVKDSILGNWLQKRVPEARGKSSAKRERRRRESLPEAQEIPRSGETNSQFLALNSCKAHTSLISCRWVVKSTKSLLPGKNVPVQCFGISRCRKVCSFTY